jgi:hypothetical protein
VPFPQTPQGRQSQREGRLVAGGIFARDRVAAGGEAHAVEQRPAGRPRHVLVADAAEAARASQPDRLVGVPRIAPVEAAQHPPHAGAHRSRPQRGPRPPRAPSRRQGAVGGGRLGQGRQQQHYPEVGIRPDLPAGFADRLQDEPADPAARQAAEGGPDRRGADHQVTVGEPRQVAAAADVARFRRHRVQEAGDLRRRGDTIGTGAGRGLSRNGLTHAS